MEKIADGSGLTLDPDLDTYYMMDAALTAAPVLLEQTARMRVLAAGVTATGQGTGDAAGELAREDGLAAYIGDQLRSDLRKVLGVHPELKPALDPADAIKAVEGFRGLGAAAPEARADAARAARIDKAGGVLADTLEELQKRDLDALDARLEERAQGARLDMELVAAALAASLLVAAYLFHSFSLVMSGGLNEVRRHLGLMAGGDLTSSPTPWGKDDAAELMHSLRETQESMRRIVSQVRGASENIVASTGEISNGTNDLSARTEHSASNLQESAAAMEEISGTVRQTAVNAQDASRLAGANAVAAARGGEIIARMVDTMHAIHGSSSRISDIIGTIDGIAFQTNILALNAAVEAARAGEAGRGFAVVASEVRALSQRTTVAAREIKTLIADSVEKVAQGTQIVSAAGGTIGEIVETSKNVNRLLNEIATGAAEQARGVAQTTQAVQDLDNLTQQNAALVEQTAAAAASLKDQAGALASEVAQFRLPHHAAPGRAPSLL
ncbi:MAG: hypothetical protein KGL43_18830 [Burkholderiales bacterium]|nr:hypothetical protein [Burkholderiales bacterium]MDE2394063.1 hypothetical protein [Burkholderiales bacterium]MDE2455648.1 hypothetical protein [Burkholderiales bacterium]